MTDGTDIAIELKEQCELSSLHDIGMLHKDTVGVEDFLQDFSAEPLRDESDFQITTVAVVRSGAEVDDTVRIERRAVALGIQTDADRAGDGLRSTVGKGTIFTDSQLGSMDIFQVILDLIAFVISHDLCLHFKCE